MLTLRNTNTRDPFSELFGFSPFAVPTEERVFRPVVETWESEDAHHIEVELAGIKQEDVELEVERGILTLSGERKRTREGKTERVYGAFSRSFRLPETVDESAISATMADGVLTITLQKAEVVKPRKIEVSTA